MVRREYTICNYNHFLSNQKALLSTSIFSIQFLQAFVVAVCCLFFTQLPAQKKAHASYFVHKVTAGETFNSIAAKYHLNPHELADYNNLDYYAGSLVSKTLRIPEKPKDPDHKKEALKKDIAKAKPVVPEPQTDTIQTPPEEIAAQETPPPVTVNSDSITTTPAPTIQTETTEKPVIASKENNAAPSAKDMFPLILFLTASVLLLIAGIYLYKVSNK